MTSARAIPLALWAVLSWTVLLAAGCSRDRDSRQQPALGAASLASSAAPAPPEPAPQLADGGVGESSPNRRDDGALVVPRGRVDFALALYSKLAAGRAGNVAITPAGINFALRLPYHGARAATAEDLAVVLGIPSSKARAEREVRRLVGRYAEPIVTDDYRLTLVSALFHDRGLQLAPEYLSSLSSLYRSKPQALDFQRQARASRLQINRWVEKATAKRLTGVVPEAAIDDETALALVVALHFKGRWYDGFDAEQTAPAIFHALDGAAVLVPTMRQTMALGYAKLADRELLELPYAGGQLTMFIVLPSVELGWSAFEAKLAHSDLQADLRKLRPHKANLSMPRFRIASEGQDVLPQLVELGLARVTGENADLTGLSRDARASLSHVFHKVVFELDERGSSAPARPNVVIRRKSPLTIELDRPFMFLIFDRGSGQILLVGRLLRP